MLGYYEGFGNHPARPVVGEYHSLFCLGCNVLQTHHNTNGDGTTWRCVVCSTIIDNSEVTG